MNDLTASLPLGNLRSCRSNFVPGGMYGSLEPFLQGYRQQRPMDLHAPRWRAANPEGSFEDWHHTTKAFVLESLHYSPGRLDLSAEVLSSEEREGYSIEKVAFNTAPWSRVDGWFLLPEGNGPFPAVIILHSWGGPLILGKDRYVPPERPHRRLTEIQEAYGGRFLAEDLARKGYAVLAIDAFHFGSRIPWNAHFLQGRSEPMTPEFRDVLSLSVEEFDALDAKALEMLPYGARFLNWAGTTWAGVNFWDDSRCVDYLVSREEVDPQRIGCVGQSGGGWRAHLLAGLDDRIAASVSSCWTTTGDWQHLYNFVGTVGYFNQLPGLWQRLDMPDLALLAAPRAAMVISGQQDLLFAPEAMEEAARQLQEGFLWANAPESFQFHYPDKPHVFDLDNQKVAWNWFERWLKPGVPSLSIKS